MNWFRQRALGLRAAFTELELRVKALEDTLASLEDKHERLRGKFYATRGSPGEPAPTQSKAEILRRFGKL